MVDRKIAGDHLDPLPQRTPPLVLPQPASIVANQTEEEVGDEVLDLRFVEGRLKAARDTNHRVANRRLVAIDESSPSHGVAPRDSLHQCDVVSVCAHRPRTASSV